MAYCGPALWLWLFVARLFIVLWLVSCVLYWPSCIVGYLALCVALWTALVSLWPSQWPAPVGSCVVGQLDSWLAQPCWPSYWPSWPCSLTAVVAQLAQLWTAWPRLLCGCGWLFIVGCCCWPSCYLLVGWPLWPVIWPWLFGSWQLALWRPRLAGPAPVSWLTLDGLVVGLGSNLGSCLDSWLAVG